MKELKGEKTSNEQLTNGTSNKKLCSINVLMDWRMELKHIHGFHLVVNVQVNVFLFHFIDASSHSNQINGHFVS